MRMRPKRPILRSLRRDVRRGEAVVFANGKRYVVVAQPIRRRLAPSLGLTASRSRLEQVAPGTCDEYEGDGGHRRSVALKEIVMYQRLRPKRPILRAMKNPNWGCWPPQVPETRPNCIPTWLTAPSGTSASPPIRCWGPAWDRSCKVCAPLPSGGETCSSFKVNDPFAPSAPQLQYGRRYR